MGVSFLCEALAAIDRRAAPPDLPRCFGLDRVAWPPGSVPVMWTPQAPPYGARLGRQPRTIVVAGHTNHDPPFPPCRLGHGPTPRFSMRRNAWRTPCPSSTPSHRLFADRHEGAGCRSLTSWKRSESWKRSNPGFRVFDKRYNFASRGLRYVWYIVSEVPMAALPRRLGPGFRAKPGASAVRSEIHHGMVAGKRVASPAPTPAPSRRSATVR